MEWVPTTALASASSTPTTSTSTSSRTGGVRITAAASMRQFTTSSTPASSESLTILRRSPLIRLQPPARVAGRRATTLVTTPTIQTLSTTTPEQSTSMAPTRMTMTRESPPTRTAPILSTTTRERGTPTPTERTPSTMTTVRSKMTPTPPRASRCGRARSTSTTRTVSG